MKKETAIKRLEKVAEERKSLGIRVKGSAAWKLIFNSLENDKPIRPCSVSGYGRHIKNMDYTHDVCLLLKLAKIRYSLENDAPRGGLTGNKITLTHIDK